ncbi:unnamed protein product [Pylaiella littoralis]
MHRIFLTMIYSPRGTKLTTPMTVCRAAQPPTPAGNLTMHACSVCECNANKLSFL